MDKVEMGKKALKVLAVTHVFEGMIAYNAARKRGKNPVKYMMLTWFLGVFVLVPLLRSEVPGEEA